MATSAWRSSLDVVAGFGEGDSDAGVDVESDVVYRERVAHGDTDALSGG
jgi:hypothetical protein